MIPSPVSEIGKFGFVLPSTQKIGRYANERVCTVSVQASYECLISSFFKSFWLEAPDFGLLPINPSNKYAGPTDMQDLRYLILLYASKYIDNFTTWREKFGSYTYISPTKLEKVANARIFHTKILFRRAGAIKDIYPRWSKGHFVMIKEGKFVAITERGEELCRNVITTMILSLPSKRKQQLTENIQTLNQSRPFRGQTKYGASELRDKAENYGLNMLSDDYKLYRGSENDFENWKNGFSFELSSIRMKQELRRDKVIEDITTKLDSEGKILIVGETGTSKSTILMEIMWDFLEAGFYVLYNFGTANIRHADGLVNFIKDLLQDGIKVLVAVDNAHEERISPIFYVTDKLFSSQLRGNLKLILTARLPEFDLFVKDRLYKVSEGIRKSIIRLTCDPNFKYPLPYFTKEEIKEFIRLYSDITDKDQSDKKCQEIYDYTIGYPIMVKFSLFSQGLSHDVRERHDRYLKSPLQMKAMLICSLLDIASLKITNFILEKCRVLKGAYYIQGATLYQSSEGTWKTIHARWDEEFLSMLYNEENKAILLDRIEFLQDAIDSIFHLGDETITDSVIRNLYDLCTKGSLPVDIVDKVVIIPEYLSKDRKRDLYGHVRGRAYINKKRYNEAIAAYDKASEIDSGTKVELDKEKLKHRIKKE